MNDLLKYSVGVNEYEVLDKDSSFALTYSIHHCICILVHKNKCAVLSHIDTLQNDYKEVLDKVLNDKSIYYIELFIGKDTTIEMIKKITDKIDGVYYEINNAFDNLIKNERSIGYDYNSGQYYKYDDYEEEPLIKVYKK